MKLQMSFFLFSRGLYPRLLSEYEQVALLQSLMIKPTMYLEELQTELNDLMGTWVHISTICRTVQRLGLTRKKVQC